MNYYPIYLDLRQRRVLLVGGGAVAFQKARALLASGAKVRLVSPTAIPQLQKLARDGKMTWSKRPYRTADLKSARLVIAATSDPEEQKRISKEARERNIWANIVDVAPLCDFIAPAIVQRGDLQIAISTGGAAPALAKYLRQKLEDLIGPEHEAFVSMVRALRPRFLELPKEKRMALWDCIVSDAFFREIRTKGIALARRNLRKWIKNA